MSDQLPRISVASPVLDGREREYVLECLDTTWISSNGRFITEFERDEVIVPSLTYIASANAVTYCGATPVFADNDARTFNLDPNAIEALITPRTRAIMVVHMYGQPCDMDAVQALAEKHKLLVVEDAAEAAGGRYKGKRVGALGAVGTFSFFGNKILTTGEGGMIVTNDDALAAKMRLLRGQGMDLQKRYWFPVVGYNYRMTNIAAAIGLAQLERAEVHLAARRRVAELYDKRLKGLAAVVDAPHVESWAEHVFWMYTVLLKPNVAKSRDQVIAELDAAGIETRPVFYPMHVMPPYAGHPRGPVVNAELCGARGINLPTHGLLSDADLDRIVATLARVLG
jgi:perosamine synthetase